MLVLSRYTGEEILIGTSDGQIVITMIETRGEKARIGITAPPTVPVHRREIWEQIERDNARRVGPGFQSQPTDPTKPTNPPDAA